MACHLGRRGGWQPSLTVVKTMADDECRQLASSCGGAACDPTCKLRQDGKIPGASPLARARRFIRRLEKALGGRDVAGFRALLSDRYRKNLEAGPGIELALDREAQRQSHRFMYKLEDDHLLNAGLYLLPLGNGRQRIELRDEYNEYETKKAEGDTSPVLEDGARWIVVEVAGELRLDGIP